MPVDADFYVVMLSIPGFDTLSEFEVLRLSGVFFG